MFSSQGEKIIKAVQKGKMTLADGIEAAVKNDDTDTFQRLRDIAQSDDQKLRFLCEELVERNALTAIEKLFRYSVRKDLLVPLFEKVIAARSLEMFALLYNHSGIYEGLDKRRLQLLLQLDAAQWQEALDLVLQRPRSHGASGGTLFEFFSMTMPAHIRTAIFANYEGASDRKLISYVSYQAPVQLEHYLNLYTGYTDANTYASWAASVLSSDAERPEVIAAFDLLFARGINANHSDGEVLRVALSKGYIEQAQQLVAAGYEPALSAQSIYERLCKDAAPRASIDFIKQYVGASSIESLNAQDGFVRTDNYSVSCVHPLPAGGQLTMLFNFASGQQIMVAQVGEQLSAPTVVPFSQIENRYLLEKAADAFVADDGNAALVAGMTTLRKPVFSKSSQPAGA